MRSYRQQFTVTLMCRVLGVSRAGFYAAERRVPGRRAQYNEILSAVISAIHKTSRQTYGSPRVHREVEKKEGKAIISV